MKLLHTMLRVGNLEASINFYTNLMGMTLLRKKDYPNGRFTLAFLGYGSESDITALELTYNWDITHYTIGDGFGHIAILVEDVYDACDKIRRSGGIISREPGPMRHGSRLLAFCKDPDGYAIELLEKQ